VTEGPGRLRYATVVAVRGEVTQRCGARAKVPVAVSRVKVLNPEMAAANVNMHHALVTFTHENPIFSGQGTAPPLHALSQ